MRGKLTNNFLFHYRFFRELEMDVKPLFKTGNSAIHRTDGTHILPDLDVQNYGRRELVRFLDQSGILQCLKLKSIFH